MNIAIILTGGCGSRMNADEPKQFIKINNKPLFIYTLESFINNVNIDKIVLVINVEYKNEYISYLNNFNYLGKVELCPGDKTRQGSVYTSIKYLSNLNIKDDDIILIHDGARPLIDQDIIDNNIKECKNHKKPVVTFLNIVDTIVDVNYNLIDRDSILSIQTPQTFLFKDLKFIHTSAIDESINSTSDDIQLAKKYGYEIVFVKGSRLNFKITEPNDLNLLKLLIKEGDN